MGLSSSAMAADVMKAGMFTSVYSVEERENSDISQPRGLRPAWLPPLGLRPPCTPYTPHCLPADFTRS